MHALTTTTRRQALEALADHFADYAEGAEARGFTMDQAWARARAVLEHVRAFGLSRDEAEAALRAAQGLVAVNRLDLSGMDLGSFIGPFDVEETGRADGDATASPADLEPPGRRFDHKP